MNTPQTETAAKKDVQKLQRAIVDGLEDVKAQDIQVFNTEALSPLFERVIIASGTSNRQTKALASSVRDAVREAGFDKPRIEGEENGEWIIVDCGPAVAHIMQPAIRQYYHLEDLWGETPVRLKLGGAKPGPKAGAGKTADEADPAPKKAPRKRAAAVSADAPAKPARAAAPSAGETAPATARKPAAPRKRATTASAGTSTAPASKAAARKSPARKASAAGLQAIDAPKAPAKTVKVKTVGAASAARSAATKAAKGVKSGTTAARKKPAAKRPG
ncbi:MAG: ribosome silencing factor [Xylophilus ampelinus]